MHSQYRIPLENRILYRNLPTRDSITDEQFNEIVEKGYHQAKTGEGLAVDKAFIKIREGI